ncbi:MAG: UPF0280 family protein [Bacillota bacterium]|nr:UPF0280 family protein [Bacillota bacterium]
MHRSVPPPRPGRSDAGQGRGEPRRYRWLGDWPAGAHGAAAEGTAAQTAFVVREGETDLWVACRPPVDAPGAASACQRRVREVRAAILAFARKHPSFLTSHDPLPVDPDVPNAPDAVAAAGAPVVRAMLEAGLRAGVGPMAAVAGAIAEDAARFLRDRYGSETVIVENGGDVFAFSPAPLTMLLLAGGSPLSGKAALRLPAAPDGISVCTSSGTVGPSFSRGKADAATVVAAGGALADALATELGNRIARAEDIEPALAWLAETGGALGGAAVVGQRLGLWGQLELVPLASGGDR